MDFFQRFSNFFTGSGWTSDEEKKRKKQQQAASPKPKSPPLQLNRNDNTIVKDSPLYKPSTQTPQQKVFTLSQAKKPEPPKPTVPVVAKPAPQAIDPARLQPGGAPVQVTKAPQQKFTVKTPQQQAVERIRQIDANATPVKTEKDKQEKSRQISELITRGRTPQVKTNYLSQQEITDALRKRDEINASIAKKGGLNAGDIAGEIGKAARDVVTNIAKSPYELYIKPTGDAFADAIYKNTQKVDESNLIKKHSNGVSTVYADPAFQKSERDSIEQAFRTRQIDANRYRELTNDLNKKVTTANTARERAREEYKAKYGEDFQKNEDVNASTLNAASNLFGIGLGTTLKGAAETGIKTIGKDVAEEAIQLGKNVSKNVGGFVDNAVANTEKAIKGVPDNVAKWLEQRKIDREQAIEAAKKEAEAAQQSRRGNVPEPTDETVAKVNGENPDLTSVANDPNATAFQRKRAQDELNAKVQAEKDAQAAANTQETALQHKQNIKNVIAEEDRKLNETINSNPGITDQEIAALRQAAAERAKKLIDELQANREKTLDLVDQQGADLAKTVDDQQKVVADVQKAQQEANVPGGNVPTSPEIDANKIVSQELRGAEGELPTRDGLSFTEKYSPNRLIRENVTRPAVNKIQEMIKSLQNSGQRGSQMIGRAATGVSREAGVDEGLQTARMNMRGSVEMGKVDRESIADLSKGFSKEQTDQVWASLDPEQAARKGIDGSNLSPEQTVLRDKLKGLIDVVTNENARRGLITEEQAANGSYIKRAYSLYDEGSDVSKFESGFRQELLGQYKGRKDVSDKMLEEAITDPTYLVGKKSAESEAMWAMQDYGNYLADSGRVIDAPRIGYTQLPDTPVFGKAAGKFVPQTIAEDFTGFQYNHAAMQAINDVITWYDKWQIRQAKKQILTIFNPAVRLGNRLSNNMFAILNGVNPVSFNRAFLQVDGMIKNNDPVYLEAVRRGLTGIDITNADFYAKRIANAAGGNKNLFNKFKEAAQKSYSKTDDKARIAAFKVHLDRGYPPEEAARMAQRGFQDYKSVGFFYDLAAKTPLIGNAFVRFAADSMRIAGNAIVDRPLTVAGTVTAWATFTNLMSIASGESKFKSDNIAQNAFDVVTGASKSEAQKARENRFGSPKLPFTNISLTVQTPYGEINAARFMPWYALNDIGGDVAKFLPFGQSPVSVEDGKVTANGAGFQDPLLGQIVQLALDKDFRNKSIKDPENTGQFQLDPLTGKQELGNQARFVATQNIPFGKEADALISAATGQEDSYGKKRSILQAALRAAGVKVEQFGDKQVKDLQATQEYFKEKEQLDKELATMTPAEQEAYKRLTGYNKLRDKTTNEFDPTKERNVKAPVYNFGEDKWKDYAQNPKIYQFMVDKKVRENAKDGKPIQPEFDPRLPDSFRKQLIQNKMVAPGDDAELDQRMYSSPEWDYYQKLKDEYKVAADKYYPQGDNTDFKDELVKHQDAKFPSKPDILKSYGTAYGLYTEGKGQKPAFTDAVKAAKEQYNKQTFDWTNTERKARGLPPITWDMWNNDTFGYDSTPSGGGGFGFGGGGSRGVDNLAPLFTIGRDTPQLADVTAQEMPKLQQMLMTLLASRGGSRAKPPLGASSRGQG